MAMTAPVNAKWSTLAAKGPAHAWFSHQAAQPYRPLNGKRGLTCPMSKRTHL